MKLEDKNPQEKCEGFYLFNFSLPIRNMPKKEMTRVELIKRYGRTVARLIAESLGYALPSCAAKILKDAREGKPNACELIYSCYNTDPLPAVRNVIKHRHYHKGFMADYRTALALVKQVIETGEEPAFGSWF